MSGTKSKRTLRVAERLKVELMELILRGAIRDPGACGVYISDVSLSDDLRYARIYVRRLDLDQDSYDQERVVRALTRASGYLRKQLGPRLNLKYLPHLQFIWDQGIDNANRVDSILDEIKREK